MTAEITEVIKQIDALQDEVRDINSSGQAEHRWRTGLSALIRAYGEQRRREGAEGERNKVLRDFRALAAYHAQREAEAKKEGR